MANSSSPQRVARWRDRVSRQSVSALTIAQFLRKEPCALAAFYAWKRRFRLAENQDPGGAISPPSAFLPVTVRIVEHAGDQLPPIEADLPNGIRLRIPTANARLACHLLRAVARANTNPGGSR